MAKGKLFEYAVIFHPRTKKDKDGNDVDKKRSQLLGDGVQRVLAETEQEVSILAARSIPAEFLDKLDEVEIVVRPF